MTTVRGSSNAARNTQPVISDKGSVGKSAEAGKAAVVGQGTAGTSKAAGKSDGFEVAQANATPSRSRPVASRPDPATLASTAYGQSGASPNQTGRVGSAAELAQTVFAGYNGGRNGPVSITPATIREGDKATPAHLVTISGTEGVEGQSTGWITNLRSGFEQNNPGLRNARDAILRTVPEGSNLVLAGHSQGGMIAQQLAADPEIQKRYNVISTVAYGSPLIAPGRREGEVHRIAAAGDPVPRLSAASVLPITGDWARLGQQDIRTDFPINQLDPRTYGRGIDAHMKDYTNESNPDLARMDALGRVNPRVPATIEFNPADRVFFTSPTNTSAPR